MLQNARFYKVFFLLLKYLRYNYPESIFLKFLIYQFRQKIELPHLLVEYIGEWLGAMGD